MRRKGRDLCDELLAAHDPDPAVRQDASLMLEIFSEVGTGEA
jgi:hypothetical protein